MINRLKIILSSFYIAAACLLLISCAAPVHDTDKLTVITTLFPLYDFSRQVGGEHADVSLLLPPGVEAHTYEPTPADIVKINNADVFIYTGNYMEPWVDDILSGLVNTNLLVVDASTNILLMSSCSNHDHEGETHHCHDHGTIDPHIWLDPLNAQIMVTTITHALAQKDPEHRNIYHANARDFTVKLKTLHHTVSNVISRCTHRMLLSGGHYTFGYFAYRYGLSHLSPYPGFSPNAEPTPKRIIELIQTMKKHGIRYIFHEELIDPDVARIIAEETGAELLMLHGAHNVSKQELKNNVSYIILMTNNLEQLKTGLEFK
jgi:zinc transport system substrate-binding protein